jgi:hypothetical protein
VRVRRCFRAKGIPVDPDVGDPRGTGQGYPAPDPDASRDPPEARAHPHVSTGERMAGVSRCCLRRPGQQVGQPVTADAGPELVASSPLRDRDVRAAVGHRRVPRVRVARRDVAVAEELAGQRVGILSGVGEGRRRSASAERGGASSWLSPPFDPCPSGLALPSHPRRRARGADRPPAWAPHRDCSAASTGASRFWDPRASTG